MYIILVACVLFNRGSSRSLFNSVEDIVTKDPSTFGGDGAEYETDRFEGDIMRDRNEEIRNLEKSVRYRWPDATVPYVIDSSLNYYSQVAVDLAIKDIEQFSCVKWVKRKEEVDYVLIKSDRGCYSYVGRIGGAQPLSLASGCHYKGIALHEMLHALGFYHEQSRSDRDEYVTVNWENVQEGYRAIRMERQFQKLNSWDEITYGSKYDFESLMHYRRSAFSKNGVDTISPKSGRYYSIVIGFSHGSTVLSPNMGQRRRMSEVDMFELNKLYKCSTAQPTLGSSSAPGNNQSPRTSSTTTALATDTTATTAPQLLTTTIPASCQDSSTEPNCKIFKLYGLCSNPQHKANCQRSCDGCATTLSYTTTQPGSLFTTSLTPTSTQSTTYSTTPTTTGSTSTTIALSTTAMLTSTSTTAPTTTSPSTMVPTTTTTTSTSTSTTASTTPTSTSPTTPTTTTTTSTSTSTTAPTTPTSTTSTSTSTTTTATTTTVPTTTRTTTATVPLQATCNDIIPSSECQMIKMWRYCNVPWLPYAKKCQKTCNKCH